MLPSIGQVITLHVGEAEHAEEAPAYKSRIADIDKEHLALETPIDDEGRVKSLFEGDRIAVSYAPSGGATYNFHSIVTGYRQENSIQLVLINKPAKADITKFQRRAYLRVEAEIEVAARSGRNTRFVGLTEDISGGGLSLVTSGDVVLQDGDVLECWLLIPFRNGAIEHVYLKGSVVRTKQVDEGLLIMLQFTDITEPDRQKILRYCFDKQLEQRK